MNDHDLQRQAERRKILKEMIQTSFPNDEATELTKEYAVWKIGISRHFNKIRCRVVVQASEPLMTDVNNNFEIVFRVGIKSLKDILDNPPLKNEYFQGTLYLDNIPVNSPAERAVKFYQGEKI
jgi:hypothetical protein